MTDYSVQIQSILCAGVDKNTLERTLRSVSNAIRVAREFYNLTLNVTFIYGDTNSNPLLLGRDIDDLKKACAGEFNLFYQHLGKNVGVANGHNMLFSTTNSQFVIIINPDVMLSTDFFVYAFKRFDNTNTGVAEARQIPIETDKAYDIRTLETDYASMECAIISRTLLEKLNGLDEHFYNAFDVDFSWRAKINGYSTIYQPLAIVYKPAELSKDGKLFSDNENRYYRVLDSLLLTYKWSDKKSMQSMLKKLERSSDKNERSAAEAFEKMRQGNVFPNPMPQNCPVGAFKNGQICKKRFIMPIEEKS